MNFSQIKKKKLTPYFGERIARYLFLQEGDHDVGVDLEWQYCQQGRQGQVGSNADERVITYRNKGNKDWSKNDSSLDGIFPEIGALKTHDELHNEKKETKSDLLFSKATILF